MHGWVGLLVKGTLKVLTWHPLYEPFLDLTFRLRFHHSMGFPVAQHVQKMMALGTLAGVPDVL